MLVVSTLNTHLPELVLTILTGDECAGCQVHNLLCEKETGRLHGFTTDGHFAEYSLTDYRNAMVLPEGMDVATAAPLFCAGITGTYVNCRNKKRLTSVLAYHAVNDCKLVAGNWVAVVGCGGLGHLGTQSHHTSSIENTNIFQPSSTRKQ